MARINRIIWKKKKDVNDPDSHDGVITDIEPDILECKVRWALGSITMNKASGVDRILVELFQILIDDAVKMLHSMCQQISKTQQWPQDWKRSVSIPIPRRTMPKNVQITIQLHTFHMLARLCSKSFKLGFNSTRTKNCQMFKLDLQTARGSSGS